ncbi:MAG: sulfite exporter TauE/SafE family protein [Candidatus Paracaedibacteraceae bacterium]|nr:sulfite exporter TauE/SafE family protein [Candidatus Paracaedibacteraceae bacterium]
MTHDLLLPVADIIVNPYFIIFIGFIGGLLTGLLGVGGGLFITPTLITLGIPPLVAVASQVNSMIGMTLTGYLTYKKNNDVDYQLGWSIMSGGLMGAVLGVVFLEWLGNSEFSKLFITLSYVCIISIMMILLFRQSRKNLVQHQSISHDRKPTSPTWITKAPFVQYFARSRLTASRLILLLAGVINGWLIAVLGVGNGIFMMPVLTYFMGRISPVTYGTTLLSSVVITIISTLVHALNGDSIDLVLVSFLLLGGLFGSYLGVSFSYRIPRIYLGFAGSAVMALILTQIGLKYFYPALFMTLSVRPPQGFDNQFYHWMQEFSSVSPLLYAVTGISLSIILSYTFQLLKSSKILQKS